MAALLHRRKLNANVEDLDFNPTDFLARINSDLVGKYVNIASRTAGFVNKFFGGKRSPPAPSTMRAEAACRLRPWTIARCYDERELESRPARVDGPRGL